MREESTFPSLSANRNQQDSFVRCLFRFETGPNSTPNHYLLLFFQPPLHLPRNRTSLSMPELLSLAFWVSMYENGIFASLSNFDIKKGKVGSVTCAVTAVSVWVKCPSWVTGALHCGLVLLTHLAALQVTAAVVHHLTSLIAGVQMKPRGTETHYSFPWCHSALVTAAPSGHKTQICGKERPENSEAALEVEERLPFKKRCRWCSVVLYIIYGIIEFYTATVPKTA